MLCLLFKRLRVLFKAKKHTRILIMSTSYFMPTSDSGKADLLDHLASNLPRYKDLLVLSDETCASVSADAKSFRGRQDC